MSSTAPVPVKNTTPATVEQKPLSGAEKAAVILSLLEPNEARQLAEQFDDGRVDRAIAAFQQLSVVSRQHLLDTVKAFSSALDGDVPIVAGGPKRADALALAILPPPADDLVPLDIAPVDAGSLEEGADAEAVWSYVKALAPEELAKLLRAERPAVISAVMAKVSRGASAAVIEMIEEETAVRVIQLMMRGKYPADRTYDAIAENLRQRAPERLNESTGEVDVTSKAAAILNVIPTRRQQAILAELAEASPEMSEALEEKVLKFSNLSGALPRSIVPTLFREVDDVTIDQALKYSLDNEPETAEFLLSCISRRLSEMIRDRISEAPSVSQDDAEKAQATIMRILIEWSEEGRFAFKQPDEDDAE